MRRPISQTNQYKVQCELLEGLPLDSIRNIFMNGVEDKANNRKPQQPGAFLYMQGYSIDQEEAIELALEKLIKSIPQGAN